MVTRNTQSPPPVAASLSQPEIATAGLANSSTDSISAEHSLLSSSPPVTDSQSPEADTLETPANSRLTTRSENPVPTASTLQNQVLNSSDLAEIKAHLGRYVTMEGSIIRVGQSKSDKTRYLNFSRARNQSVAVAISVNELDDSFPMSHLESLVGRNIRVRGKVREVFGEILVYLEAPSDLEVQP